MNAIRVYDLPTRAFHWTFAGLFAGAYAIASTVDDGSARFAWHMLAGLLLGVTVLLRVAWGIVGTRHARWADLQLDPRALATYLRGVVSGGGRRWAGHNPASSWAALSMMAVAIALVGSGVAMASGAAPEWVEEAHELLANAFLAVALLHVGGLAVHALRHRDALPLAMVDGRKRGLPAGTAPVSARPLAALLMLAVLAATGVQLARGYDPARGTLDVLGLHLLPVEDGHGEDLRDAGSGHDEDEGRGEG